VSINDKPVRLTRHRPHQPQLPDPPGISRSRCRGLLLCEAVRHWQCWYPAVPKRKNKRNRRPLFGNCDAVSARWSRLTGSALWVRCTAFGLTVETVAQEALTEPPFVSVSFCSAKTSPAAFRILSRVFSSLLAIVAPLRSRGAICIYLNNCLKMYKRCFK
jgi:hypothetical protein